jgi:hypothetical protein
MCFPADFRFEEEQGANCECIEHMVCHDPVVNCALERGFFADKYAFPIITADN